MQILQSIHQGELRPKIQLQGSVADGSEIHQHDTAVSLLQCDSCIYRGRGGTDSALGVEKSKHTGLARAALRPAQCGRKARESLKQRLTAGVVIEKLARARPHRGHNVRRLVHFADGKNRDLGNASVNQFDGADGSLRIVRIDIDQNDFNPLIL